MAEPMKPENKVHTCPFCDSEIAEAAFPYCEACDLKVLRCPQCGMAVPRDREKCPQCGADMKNVVLEQG
jgi:RNA polymerase subunit RPABC4/transcription elongation factor Spt4